MCARGAFLLCHSSPISALTHSRIAVEIQPFRFWSSMATVCPILCVQKWQAKKHKGERVRLKSGEREEKNTYGQMAKKVWSSEWERGLREKCHMREGNFFAGEIFMSKLERFLKRRCCKGKGLSFLISLCFVFFLSMYNLG